jgi:hypothetical protein
MACHGRIQHNYRGGPFVSSLDVLRKRPDPLDAKHLRLAANIAGQRNDAGSVPVRNADERGMWKHRLAGGVGEICVAYRAHDLHFHTGQRAADLDSRNDE